MRLYLGGLFALFAVDFALYFIVVRQLAPGNVLFAYVAVGLFTMAFAVGQRYFRRKLLGWELGTLEQIPDETSSLRGLRNNWPFLIGVVFFGPCIALLGGFQGVPGGVIMFLFTGALVPAIWPVVTGRAPFSFWAIATVLLLIGGWGTMALI